MRAAVFTILCEAGRSALYARENEARARERFDNGESDWARAISSSHGDWLNAVQALLIALNAGDR